MTTENHPTQSLAEGAELKTVSWAEAKAFSARLAEMLLSDDMETVIIGIGAKSPDPDCEIGSCLVEIVGNVGSAKQAFTGNALNILDAAMIARGKLADAREALQRERKKPSRTQETPHD